MSRAALSLTVNGRRLKLPAGISVAAALADVPGSFRRSVDGEPRAPLCGIGVCFECRVRIDGVSHVRACMVLARHGMQVQTDD